MTSISTGRVPRLASLALAALALGAVLATPATARQTVDGRVLSGLQPLAGATVAVHATGVAQGRSRQLGRTVTDRRGRFRLSYRAPRRAGAAIYLTAGRGAAVRLAATLGWGARVPGRAVVNELTTVAAGYALAQFVSPRGTIGGPHPGPRNGAMMARNLADPRTGRVGRVLRTAPNGGQTRTLATFRSVANMLPACVRSARRCGPLLRLAGTPGGAPARGALQAVANIARNPWQNVGPLARLARSGPTPYRGALGPRRRPAGWTLPVRFDGDGKSMDGPGNIAIDREGNLYVANNYEYGARSVVPRCGSDQLPKFRPDGSYAPRSPFTGGGLSGAGYGITLDPRGNIWVGNFGFAAPTPGCPAHRQPLHNSVSAFTPHGVALSGENGFVAGDIYYPQGTVSDANGTIWVANCGNGKVTRMPGDRPHTAVGYDVGLEEAFDIAIDHRGQVYATGLGNSSLAMLDNSGAPLPGSPLGPRELGLNRPMGIAADSRGNMWIANSGLINLPCPKATFDFESVGGSLSLLGADGTAVTRGEDGAFTGGGLTVPWGIAVDGNDNVWVSNFFGRRISQFCGVTARGCRPGGETGDAISPRGTGYRFDGLTRSTAVQIDPAGNVWATNNWKLVPIQANPGGYEIVAFVGAAAPLRTPLIGPPVPLMP
ncbi:MAG: hypothetical protein GXY03_11455 [Solirubrobacterales bacterium]|nr:hypothetical protein [Solirubrobacterales bacterium]